MYYAMYVCMYVYNACIYVGSVCVCVMHVGWVGVEVGVVVDVCVGMVSSLYNNALLWVGFN